MTPEKFDVVVEEMIDLIRETLKSKAVQYARGNDRLWNFKRAAERRRCTPEEALRGISVKHEVAIDDFINDLAEGGCMPYEQWVEKVMDSVIYNFLLMGLVKERLKEGICKKGHPVGEAPSPSKKLSEQIQGQGRCLRKSV